MCFSLVTLVLNVRLGEVEDNWVLSLGTKSTFLVKVMYNDVILSGRVPRRHTFRKLKIPLTTTDRAICPGSKGLFVPVLEPGFGRRDKSTPSAFVPGGRTGTKCPSR